MSTQDKCCSICGDNCVDEDVLACTHALCKECLFSSQAPISKAAESGWELNAPIIIGTHCPICRAPIPSAKLLPSVQRLAGDCLSLGLKKVAEEHLRPKCECGKVCRTQGVPCPPMSPDALPRFVMGAFSFYKCTKCTHVFFGGLRACLDGLQNKGGPEGGAVSSSSSFSATTTMDTCSTAAVSAPISALICPSCEAMQPGSHRCPKHGHEALQWKCFHCCAPATQFCRARNYYCEVRCSLSYVVYYVLYSTHHTPTR